MNNVEVDLNWKYWDSGHLTSFRSGGMVAWERARSFSIGKFPR